jgi:thiamine biosynthesis protein ThiI
MSAILIHYGEIALKGGNREFFEKKLIANIRKSLGFKHAAVKNFYGRILAEIGEGADFEFLENKLKKVFGIANFSFCKSFNCPGIRTRGLREPIGLPKPKSQAAEQLDEIKNAVWEFVKNKNFKSFKISAKRGDKLFPVDSQQINQIIGAFVREKTKAKVDLENPDLTCFIEIGGGKMFIYDKKIKGAGGMPAGVAGKLVSLISSGFDSPVASYLMAKRGAQIVFVHYHSYPQTSLASRENIEELVKILSEYQAGSKIYFVNILKIQKQIMMGAPEKFRVVLYRRAMVKIANEIAKKENALGLVTGDSLGQVASQTLENLNTVSRISELPIYRPLIGFDKEEIIDLSKKIGFYEISSQPYDDCCSLFVPKHPATKSDIETIEKIEGGLKLGKLLSEATKRNEIKIINSKPDLAR